MNLQLTYPQGCYHFRLFFFFPLDSLTFEYSRNRRRKIMRRFSWKLLQVFFLQVHKLVVFFLCMNVERTHELMKRMSQRRYNMCTNIWIFLNIEQNSFTHLKEQCNFCRVRSNRHKLSLQLYFLRRKTPQRLHFHQNANRQIFMLP